MLKTVLNLGPEDPDPASNGDGCVYAVNGGQGAVHRICFDDSKTVSSDTVDSDHAESRLSSAVLRVRSKDTGGDVDTSFDGNCGDVNTQDACDVDVYASGPALFRINSGGGVFVDSLGLTWSADTFFAADRDGPTRRSSLRA